MAMNKKKSIVDRGLFKQEISSALYRSADIRELLLGDTSGKSASAIQSMFKEHVKSHLYVDETVQETDTFIFYDVVFPSLHENIKDCRVVMYVMSHVDIIDDYYKDGYYGNRVDILTQMVEDALVNDTDVANSFGIGRLNLDSLELYQATKFYGTVLTFSVPNFR